MLNRWNNKSRSLRKIFASLACFAFVLSNAQHVHAQDFSISQLPVPGAMVGVSAPFAPLALKGLVVNPQKPLEFQFIIDTGKGPQDTAAIKDQANQLVKYFLAGLTIPEGDLWVNLSPYEKDRITTPSLGQTELGRDLLAQDYILKQLTASLIYPEKDLGKEFWSRVYAKAKQRFGTMNIPVNTFNKVWIIPDQAQVYENVNAAYVTKSTLKVMLDEDYLAKRKNQLTQASSVSSQILREVVIPEITKEVNTGKNFAPLRQIYQALILAKWYKEAIQNGLLDAVYTNKKKVAGVNVDDPKVREEIYQRYLSAYKRGVFDYIKKDPTLDCHVVSRKYFSGGIAKLEPEHLDRSGMQADVKNDGAVVELKVDLRKSQDEAMTADELVEALSSNNLLPAERERLTWDLIKLKKIDGKFLSEVGNNKLTINAEEKEYLDGKTIIVTGGLGFIGYELIKMILREASPKKIIVIDRMDKSPTYTEENLQSLSSKISIEFRDVDIADKEALSNIFENEGAQIVFHLAAERVPERAEYFPINALRSNILGTRNLVELSKRFKIERFVHVSTGKARIYFDDRVYPVSKLLAERIVHGAAEDSGAGGTMFSIVRIHQVLENSDLINKQMIGGLNRNQEIEIYYQPNYVMPLQNINETTALIVKSGYYGKRAEVFGLSRSFNVKDSTALDISLQLIKERGSGRVKVVLPPPGHVTEIFRGFTKQDDHDFNKSVFNYLEYGKYIELTGTGVSCALELPFLDMQLINRVSDDLLREDGRPIKEKIPLLIGALTTALYEQASPEQLIKVLEWGVDLELVAQNKSFPGDHQDFLRILLAVIREKVEKREMVIVSPKARDILNFLLIRFPDDASLVRDIEFILRYLIFHNLPPAEAWRSVVSSLQEPDGKTHIIGLVGGIGSGKSTARSLLQRYPHVGTIDFDAARHSIFTIDKVKKELVDNFGSKILNPKGEVDSKVYNDLRLKSRDNTKKFEQILYPYIYSEMYRRILELKNTPGIKLIVIEGLSFYRSGMNQIMDEVWLVDAPEEVRIERVMQREGQAREEVIEKIRNQEAILAHIRGLVDVVINNLQGIGYLEARVKEEKTRVDSATMNGGIDLNQISVKRNGKVVNVKFDPAQLNALTQGGFEGFAPVIINITHISSPFQLLGIKLTSNL